MKERPIIMGAESVRAILEGRKTQTRRVIDPRKYNIAGWDMPRTKEDMKAGYPFAENADGDSFSVVDWCPYGRVGDRLYVKETFKIAEGVTINGVAPVIYKAECSGFALANIDNWKSPLFMPRWASRITLEITDIRVEMVNDISEEDAITEGVEFGSGWEEQCGECYCTGEGWMDYKNADYGCSTPKESYKTLWNSLNAKRGYPWEKNPWVWAVTFKVVQ